ncbi:hypothetical protein QJQ45_012317 [Haematococcus lacustris]|nr:hypothetical protein QJQ45_012317 [Haematococcus lacustris]
MDQFVVRGISAQDAADNLHRELLMHDENASKCLLIESVRKSECSKADDEICRHCQQQQEDHDFMREVQCPGCNEASTTDCNAALNMQRIGESRWRPLELCFWPDQGALPAKGKEYPGLGYKRLRDKPPKAQQQQAPPI